MMTLRDRIAARFFLAKNHYGGEYSENALEHALKTMKVTVQPLLSEKSCYGAADAVLEDVRRTMTEEVRAKLNEHAQRETGVDAAIDESEILDPATKEWLKEILEKNPALSEKAAKEVSRLKQAKPDIKPAVPTGKRNNDQPAKVIQLRENLKVEGGAELQREVKVPDTVCGLWRNAQGEAVLQATYNKDYVRCTKESVGVLRREGDTTTNTVDIYVCQDHRKLRKEINHILRSTYVGKQLAQHGIDLGGYKFIPHGGWIKAGECSHPESWKYTAGGKRFCAYCIQTELGYDFAKKTPLVTHSYKTGELPDLCVCGKTYEEHAFGRSGLDSDLHYYYGTDHRCVKCGEKFQENTKCKPQYIDDSLQRGLQPIIPEVVKRANEAVKEQLPGVYERRVKPIIGETHAFEGINLKGPCVACGRSYEEHAFGTYSEDDVKDGKRMRDSLQRDKQVDEMFKSIEWINWPCAICKRQESSHKDDDGSPCRRYVDPRQCLEQKPVAARGVALSVPHEYVTSIADMTGKCLTCGGSELSELHDMYAATHRGTIQSVPQNLSSMRVRDESPVAIDCKICGHLEPGQPHDNEKHKNDPRSLYYFREPSENYRYELVKEALDPAPGSVSKPENAAEQAQDEKAPQNAGSEPSREPTSLFCPSCHHLLSLEMPNCQLRDKHGSR